MWGQPLVNTQGLSVRNIPCSQRKGTTVLDSCLLCGSPGRGSAAEQAAAAAAEKQRLYEQATTTANLEAAVEARDRALADEKAGNFQTAVSCPFMLSSHVTACCLQAAYGWRTLRVEHMSMRYDKSCAVAMLTNLLADTYAWA